MHFFVFLLWQRCCGDVALRGYALRRGVCALRRLLRRCRHYSRFACITSAEPTSPHQRCRLNTIHLVCLLSFVAEDLYQFFGFAYTDIGTVGT